MSRRLGVIVVGGGIAGLDLVTHLLVKAADRPVDVRLLTKSAWDESSSAMAQGGVAAACAPMDRTSDHVRDTLAVGCGRNDPAVVERIIAEAPEAVEELVGLGARFDRTPDGRFELAREGGHSTARVLHHLDRTGVELMRVLRQHALWSPSVMLSEDLRAFDLIVEGEGEARRCAGVKALDLRNGDVLEMRADIVVLATGGVGMLYQHTTNPVTATGDGIAMAMRADVELEDMAFVQFHPTALFTGAEGRLPLVSEAVRGAGGRLLKPLGGELMKGVHPMGDLAPRNVVARTIQMEMDRTGSGHVWLDCSPIGAVRSATLFPTITAACRRIGVEPGVDLVPVVPAAHYLCGGIRTDDRGRTSLRGLLALGECACTGLHGADRLASNSLLEALVVPRRAVDGLLADSASAFGVEVGITARDKRARGHSAIVQRSMVTLRHAMTTHLGIIRDREGMHHALHLIGGVERAAVAPLGRQRWTTELLDLRDMLCVARAITDAALNEPRSVGTHYVVDRSTVMDRLPWTRSFTG